MAVVQGLPEFKKASDFRGKLGLDMVLFGPPGIGKTTFVATADDSEFGKSLLLFDIDAGLKSIEDLDVAVWPDRDEMPDPTWRDFRAIVDKIIAAGADSPYKTLAFDSLSSIYYDLILPKVTGSKEAQPKIQDWGEANRILIKFMSDVMTLNSKGINTIFIGHVQEEKEIIDPDKPDNYIIHVRLAGSPKGRDEILRTVGTVGFYDWDRRFQNRVLKFKPERRIDAPKFRQPRSGTQMPSELVNPTMHTILQHARKASS